MSKAKVCCCGKPGCQECDPQGAIAQAVEDGYLDEFCDFTGLEANKPAQIFLPPDVAIIPTPGFKYSLTAGEGLDFKINEDLVKYIEENWDTIWFKDANGNKMDRAKFKEIYGKDPLWILAYMRQHKGVQAHPNIRPADSVTTTTPRPTEKPKRKPVKLGKG